VRRFLATWALRRLLSPDSSRRRRRWAARVTRFETRRLASHRLRESGTGSPWTAELAGAPATGSRRAGASARAPRLSGWHAARAWRPPSRWAASVRQIAGPRTRASVTLGSARARRLASPPRRPLNSLTVVHRLGSSAHTDGAAGIEGQSRWHVGCECDGGVRSGALERVVGSLFSCVGSTAR